MHAQRIIQEFLDAECPEIHAKRRNNVAAIVDASSRGSLSLMGMSRVLNGGTTLRHKIKRCDRLLSNHKLNQDHLAIYGAMTRRLLHQLVQPMIIVDWSDLHPDRSQQLLRAALIVKGRALTLYEEVHPIANAQSPLVHKEFVVRLQQIIPAQCHPVFITDAGFRSPWFALLNQLGYAWIGRIRNRDMVSRDKQSWRGCKELYCEAKHVARGLGEFHYVRSKSVACQLVIVKKKPRGRHLTTVRGQVRTNSRSQKQAKSQTEPWLLAVSPQLKGMTAKAIVATYSGRMQIEQTFRDIKNPRWGLGLSHSQTRKADRLANLLLIGALACYALWLIALTIRTAGYRIEFGSKKKAAQALSLISLARWWLDEKWTVALSRRQIDDALITLRSMIFSVQI